MFFIDAFFNLKVASKLKNSKHIFNIPDTVGKVPANRIWHLIEWSHFLKHSSIDCY